MTRINTNVSSLIAQRSLQRSNVDLQLSLTRLSTGLRINSGRDDPSGLIASEALRSDIGAIRSAIGNSERANQVITTADSALAQVSDLLNDIRGLVVEAANSGGMSADQIAANQLEIDQSLSALNQISQTTSFQGLRLLDGSLDFISTVGSIASVTTSNINQANLGATGSVAIDADISAAATQATITNTQAFSAATTATTTLLFGAEAQLTGFNDGATDILIQATTPGASMENIVVSFAAGAVAVGSEVATYDSTANTLVIQINNAAATTSANVVNAINALGEFSATETAAGAIDGSIAGDVAIADTTDADQIVITAANAGPDYNNVAVQVVADSGTPAGAPTAAYDTTTKIITLTVNDTAATTLANANTAINNLSLFSSALTAGGDGNITGNTSDGQATANTDTTGGGLISADLVLQISGADGAQALTFQSGASINQIRAAISQISDSTGVNATQSGTTLTLTSLEYGSSKFVDVEVISEGAGGGFLTGLSASRATGTDIVATINGIKASGDGNKFSIKTGTLDMSLTVSAGSSTNFDFTITGGGALFQLGPDVVSNQQARLGIQSVNTAKLGGNSGLLYQLNLGESADLSTDANTAAKIVTEAINAVTSLRGRLGAFQKTSLDSNIASLNDTLVNLTDAESAIRDADFAVETANLTRAQILVQSGTTVLGIANSNPQNVLALLR